MTSNDLDELEPMTPERWTAVRHTLRMAAEDHARMARGASWEWQSMVQTSILDACSEIDRLRASEAALAARVADLERELATLRPVGGKPWTPPESARVAELERLLGAFDEVRAELAARGTPIDGPALIAAITEDDERAAVRRVPDAPGWWWWWSAVREVWEPREVTELWRSGELVVAPDNIAVRSIALDCEGGSRWGGRCVPPEAP